jgi:hypothetical protein
MLNEMAASLGVHSSTRASQSSYRTRSLACVHQHTFLFRSGPHQQNRTPASPSRRRSPKNRSTPATVSPRRRLTMVRRTAATHARCEVAHLRQVCVAPVERPRPPRQDRQGQNGPAGERGLLRSTLHQGQARPFPRDAGAMRTFCFGFPRGRRGDQEISSTYIVSYWLLIRRTSSSIDVLAPIRYPRRAARETRQSLYHHHRYPPAASHSALSLLRPVTTVSHSVRLGTSIGLGEQHR